MYKQAIKMNAENRINASNSWNLRLIENIDKFLTEDDTSSPERSTLPSQQSDTHGNSNEGEGHRPRVNFTKASCTLDASVKIYSYRVDDVHLTSYRVLENLHRSDGDKNKRNKNNIDGPNDNDEASAGTGKTQTHRSRAATSTIESNLGKYPIDAGTLRMPVQHPLTIFLTPNNNNSQHQFKQT